MTLNLYAKRIAFSLVAVTIFFLFLEGLLWVVGRQASERRQHAPIPSGSENPPLLCAGDSVTFGLGADTIQSYPSQLARLPEVSALDRNVVNLGRAGQTMHDALNDLNAYLETHPTPGATVLLLAGFNDCVHLKTLISPPRPMEKKARPVQDLLNRTRTYRLLKYILAHLEDRDRAHPAGLPPMGYEHDRALCRYKLTEQGLDLTLDLYKQNLEVLTLTYPVPIQHKFSDLPYVTTQVNTILREETRERDIPLIDIEACVQAAEREAGIVFFDPDGIHLNSEGYGAMARCIATRLRPFLEAPSILSENSLKNSHSDPSH